MPRLNSSKARLAIGLGLGISLFAAAPIGFLLYGKVMRRGPAARAWRAAPAPAPPSRWPGLPLPPLPTSPPAPLASPWPAQADTSKPMPANNAIRGAYINSQSRDIGPDRPV